MFKVNNKDTRTTPFAWVYLTPFNAISLPLKWVKNHYYYTELRGRYIYAKDSDLVQITFFNF